jgi:transposase-like protein
MEMRTFRDSSTMVEQGVFDGGTEGARRATGVAPSIGGTEETEIMSPPDPEVPEKKPRRKYTARYKLRILEEADACTKPGQIGALLRREGLYSSNLTSWRKQKEKGQLEALSPKKRGRKEKEKNPLTQRMAQLERENERLKKKLKQAETIIDVQKKISEILGISQDLPEEEGIDS